VEFRVLGPVGLLCDGQERRLGGPKQRALLALLLLNANRVVSRDRLIDGLWGERTPSSAEHSLDGYVSRLRKLVGQDRLVRERHGYRLVVEPGELDLDRFERLASEGRFAEALGEWHDEPLADLSGEPFAAAAARELSERRLVTTEQRLEVDLSLGRTAELVPELERLVRDEPFRERPVRLLALALHRSGRSADALAQLADARRRFASELGLEVSPDLRELERRILQHDPELFERRGLAFGMTRSRPLPLLVGAGLVVAAAVAITAVLVFGRRDHDKATKMLTGQLVELGDKHAVGVDGAPSALVAGGGGLWLAEPSQSLVLRVDPVSHSVTDRVQVQGVPGAFAAGGGAVWVATSQPGAIQRVDFTTDEVTQTIPLGINVVALAFARGRLWAADSSDQSLIEIDPATGSATRTIPLTSHPSSLAVSGQTAWIASHDDGTITEVDLSSGAPLETASVGAGPTGVALAADAVWIANGLAGTLTRLDPATMSISETIPTGSGPSAAVAADGSVWVANEFSQTLTRIATATNRISETRELGGAPVSLAVARGRVWAATRPILQHRGGRLVLLLQGPVTSMDPQIQYEIQPPQLTGLVYDALVTFNHTGGSQGLQIVPDLALAVPTPTDGGRTYAFRLRPGVRYSNGRFVLASDVRRSFERLFRVRSPVAPFFDTIVGAAGCDVNRCDLSRGITIDDARRTVVFHLTRLDPEFLYKLAFVFTAPVPPGTPWTELKVKPFPGTGPYRIVDATRRGLRLVRNASFREWSRAAQPEGNPDEVDWRFGLSVPAEVAAVAAGRADWLFDNVPGSMLASLKLRHPAQLHAAVAPETDFVAINASKPPFSDVRVRRAFNLAIDRSRVVAYYGHAARPTCQVLPPGVPGFVPYCPYRYDPASARRLVAAAHARGEVVTIAGFTDDPTIHRPLILYLVSVLRRLGLVPHVLWTSHAAFSGGRYVNLIPQGWYADYPAASDFFGIFLACNGAYNNGKFCDRTLDREIAVASRAEALHPAHASALWARADRRAVDDAAWAPLANPTLFDFVSKRLHGYQRHLLWGFLADQTEVR
jgi:ABC-type transport system substrate-binding protein/DNA-binding SARP family transcriptional activator